MISLKKAMTDEHLRKLAKISAEDLPKSQKIAMSKENPKRVAVPMSLPDRIQCRNAIQAIALELLDT